MAHDTPKGTVAVLENKAPDVQLGDGYCMGLQVLQTFGLLRLNLNLGFGRQELTAHEIKIIMVAENNWGRW